MKAALKKETDQELQMRLKLRFQQMHKLQTGNQAHNPELDKQAEKAAQDDLKLMNAQKSSSQSPAKVDPKKRVATGVPQDFGRIPTFGFLVMGLGFVTCLLSFRKRR